MFSRILNISEASSLALHAMCYISQMGECVSSAEIAKATRASQTHMSKVLRKLVVGGFLEVTKGPYGGFTVAKKKRSATFMEIYELFEGECNICPCAFSKGPCGGKDCIFGGLIEKINHEFVKFFNKTKISKQSKKNRK